MAAQWGEACRQEAIICDCTSFRSKGGLMCHLKLWTACSFAPVLRFGPVDGRRHEMRKQELIKVILIRPEQPDLEALNRVYDILAGGLVAAKLAARSAPQPAQDSATSR